MTPIRQRILVGILVIFAAATSLLFLMPSIPPGAAQGQPTPAYFTPTPFVTPTTPLDEVLREVQRTNGEVQRTNADIQRTNADTAIQVQNLANALGNMQNLTILFAAIAVLAVLFGIVVYVDYRGNVGRMRDLQNNVIDETKRMRVVEEGVRLRAVALDEVANKVSAQVASMQDELRSQLQIIYETNDKQAKDMQAAIDGKFRDLDASRKAVETLGQTLQTQIRDQMLAVNDRGDRQMKALMDVVGNQLRDIAIIRTQMDTTSQEMRNQIRDQLQVVYDRGDKQTRDWVAALSAGLKDVNTVRREMEEAMQGQRDQIRDGLVKVYERGDIQMKEIQTILANRLKDFEALRSEIQVMAGGLQDRIRNEISAARETIGEMEVLRGQIDSEFKTAIARLTAHQDEQQDKVSKTLVAAHMAQQQITRGELSAAAMNLRQATTITPDNRMLRYLLAEALVRQGRTTEAIQELILAGAGKGEYPAADALYGYALRAQGDTISKDGDREELYAQSANILLKTMENNPDLRDADGESVYGALASLYRRRGQLPQAAAFYEHLLRLTPESSYLYNNLAILNYQMGNLDQAKKYFAQAESIAAAKVTANRANYWAWFDMLTADVGQEAPNAEIERELNLSLSLAPNADALSKLLIGIESLRSTAKPPKQAEKVATAIRERIRALKKAEQHT